MKYQDVRFYISSDTSSISSQIGKELQRTANTILAVNNIPKLYSFLSSCRDYTCFIFQLSNENSMTENMIKAVRQNNPFFPIILLSSNEIFLDIYRSYLKLGVTDLFQWNTKTESPKLFQDIIEALKKSWSDYQFNIHENMKTFRATVVTVNHQINQPLTVILNAIGLLNVELKEVLDKGDKIQSHFNFISKSASRIQAILGKLKSMDSLNFVEYTPGVQMIDLYPEKKEMTMAPKKMINVKDTILLISQELHNGAFIESEIKKLGLDIVIAKDLDEAGLYLNQLVDKLQAIIFSSSLPVTEMESAIFKRNDKEYNVPVIIIKSDRDEFENEKTSRSNAYQILDQPVNANAIKKAISNSVLIKT